MVFSQADQFDSSVTTPVCRSQCAYVLYVGTEVDNPGTKQKSPSRQCRCLFHGVVRPTKVKERQPPSGCSHLSPTTKFNLRNLPVNEKGNTWGFRE